MRIQISTARIRNLFNRKNITEIIDTTRNKTQKTLESAMPQSNNRQDQDQDQDHELKHKRNQHINSNEHLPQITAPQARTNKESQKSHKLAGPALQQHIDHVEHNVLKLHPSSTVLHLSNGPLNHAAISNNVKEARYAVRGALAIRAEELKHVSSMSRTGSQVTVRPRSYISWKLIA